MESAICDLCHYNQFEVIISELYPVKMDNEIIKLPSNTVICHRCGHIFNTPRMDQQEISRYYATTQRQNFEGGEFSPRKKKIYQSDVAFISGVLGDGNGRAVMDVGCYSGMLLHMISEKGWVPHGIEPSEESVRIAEEKYGLDIFCGMFEDYQPENETRYPLLILGSILEHFNSPTKALLHANSLIETNGYLYIRVPNAEFEEFRSIGHYFPIEHVNMYSSDSLELFLKKTGFKTIKISSAGDSMHILCLARKTESVSEARNLTHAGDDLYQRMRQKLQGIVHNYQKERNRVNVLLKKLWDPGRKAIAIYGAGTHTDFLLRFTDIGKANIHCLIDSNPGLHGKTVFGYPVKSPEEIPSLEVDSIVISSRAFEDDIYASINKYDKEVVRLYG